MLFILTLPIILLYVKNSYFSIHRHLLSTMFSVQALLLPSFSAPSMIMMKSNNTDIYSVLVYTYMCIHLAHYVEKMLAVENWR